MTNARLHNARLIDPETGTETLGWLRIEGGADRGNRRGAATGRARTAAGSCLAPGLVDVGVKVGEPGERSQGKPAPPPVARRRPAA